MQILKADDFRSYYTKNEGISSYQQSGFISDKHVTVTFQECRQSLRAYIMRWVSLSWRRVSKGITYFEKLIFFVSHLTTDDFHTKMLRNSKKYESGHVSISICRSPTEQFHIKPIKVLSNCKNACVL